MKVYTKGGTIPHGSSRPATRRENMTGERSASTAFQRMQSSSKNIKDTTCPAVRISSTGVVSWQHSIQAEVKADPKGSEMLRHNPPKFIGKAPAQMGRRPGSPPHQWGGDATRRNENPRRREVPATTWAGDSVPPWVPGARPQRRPFPLLFPRDLPLKRGCLQHRREYRVRI